MRVAVCSSIIALLAGCYVVPPQAWNFDPTRLQPQSPLPSADAAALTDQLAQLQLQRNQVRADIAVEPDIWKRQAHYLRLHQIGVELSPLERRLSSAAAR